MAAASQSEFEALNKEFEIVKKQLNEGLAPKIAQYDEAAAQFATWRTAVDALLSGQDAKQRELYMLANTHITELRNQMIEVQNAIATG